MRLVDGHPVLSASDLADFLDCEHVTSLEQRVAAGDLKRPYFPDPSLELLVERGLQHEQRYLETLRSRLPGEVVEIAWPSRKESARWREAADQSRAAMVKGAAIVYQGTFLEDRWRGRADFLVRMDSPSALGPWSYEVVDTKLATHTKARAIIQLCVYSDMLARVQGRQPDSMRIVLGRDAGEETHRVSDYLAFVHALRRRMLARFAKQAAPTYPEPVEHCGICDFVTTCKGQWREDDHLSLVAGISRRQRDCLTEAGISTLAGLGSLSLPPPPPARIDIGKPALLRIREQARLQVQGRQERRMVHELIRPVVPECGLASLPPPSPGDLYFDIEGDPWAVDGGLEYLLGLVEPPDAPGTAPRFHGRWAFTPADEKQQFEAFMDFVMARLERHPGMHIYHYAPYEPTALKRMMGRHGTREAEVDRLLRGGVLVDLYRAVRQGVRASVESYSIKKLEPLYGYERDGPPADRDRAAWQLFAVHLADGAAGQADRTELQEIEGYNRDDCVSTFQLHRWLEAAARRARAPHRRIAPPSGAPAERSDRGAGEAGRARPRRSRRACSHDVPEDPGLRTPEQAGPLAAGPDARVAPAGGQVVLVGLLPAHRADRRGAHRGRAARSAAWSTWASSGQSRSRSCIATASRRRNTESASATRCTTRARRRTRERWSRSTIRPTPST